MPEHDSTLLLLGRLEGKLDALIQQTTNMNTRLESHEERITSLEKWKSYIIGASAVAGAIAGKLWEYAMK